jgi:hypothetical protein
MINIIKNITENPTTVDEILQCYKIVESSYVPTLDEEFVVDPIGVENLYDNSRIDIIQYRTYLMEYCCPLVVWTTLPQEQRDKCIHWYQKPNEVSWDALGYSDVELQAFWHAVVIAESKARYNRVKEGMAIISWHLNKPEAMDLFLTVEQYIYRWVEADLPFLYWYLTDAVIPGVVDFSTTGFSSKPYYSIERKNVMIDIIIR